MRTLAHIFTSCATVAMMLLSVNAFGQTWFATGNALTTDGILGTTTGSNWGVKFLTNGTERMRLDNSGKLLIGLSSVPGTPPSTAKVYVMQGWSDWMQFRNTNNTGYFSFHNTSTMDHFILNWTPSSGASSAMFSVRNDGKFVIGTSLPLPGNYKLYVQDGILTEKVKVAVKTSADWSDYVFSPTYCLMPLNEVNEYILTNGHLPGVPSANDMVSNGLDVAMTDAMLLAKIEELTLYILDLEKRIKLIEQK